MPSSRKEYLVQALNKLAEKGIKAEYIHNEISAPLNKLIIKSKKQQYAKMSDDQKKIIGKINLEQVTPEDLKLIETLDGAELFEKFLEANKVHQESIKALDREFTRDSLFQQLKTQGLQMNERIVKE